MLWSAMILPIPPSLKNVVILCGTNNLFPDCPTDMADGIANMGSCLCEKSSNMNVFICGLLPRDESWSINWVLIKGVNRILEYLCLKLDFPFIGQSDVWTLPNVNLYPSPFFRDSIHLTEEEIIT